MREPEDEQEPPLWFARMGGGNAPWAYYYYYYYYHYYYEGYGPVPMAILDVEAPRRKRDAVWEVAAADLIVTEREDGLSEVERVGLFSSQLFSDEPDPRVSEESLHAAREPEEVLERLEAILDRAEVIWYYGRWNNYDWDALNKTCRRHVDREIRIDRSKIRDIYDLAREVFPDPKKLPLDVTLDLLGIEVPPKTRDPRDRHRAEGDVLLEFEAFKQLASRVDWKIAPQRLT
jgi:hypothetical protein